MSTILWVNWLRLRRDRVALGLTFVLPILFFSIFAMIFGGMGRGGGSGPGPAKRVRVAVVDEDKTEISARMIEALGKQESLELRTQSYAIEGQPPPEPYTREEARHLVRTQNRYPVAVVIPDGFGDAFGNFTEQGDPVELIYDAANPIAHQMVAGLLQAAAMQAAPEVLLERGVGTMESFGGFLTEEQRQVIARFKEWMNEEPVPTESAGDALANAPSMFADGLVSVVAEDVRAQEAGDKGATQSRSLVAYYAAGIGVMFLLFSMTGAGGSLLDEAERGTLERVLSSNVSMTTLLTGNWLFFAMVGMAQIAIMFVWGAAVFGLELWYPNQLAGSTLMTVVTALAASAFGIVLATICTSRAQLSGLSTIIILTMSALGGSMVPRFVMPAFMEQTAKFTFNGWALDGYLKVFWYNNPDHSVLQSLGALWLEVLVLSAMTVVFLILAGVFSKRWQSH